MRKNIIETEIQFKKRKEKEYKEILKWEKEKARPRPKWYFVYFIFIILMVYIIDEITSQIGTQMQDVITSVLSNILGGAQTATSVLNLASIITAISSIFAFFYKPLSDRYGRKLFLVINTLGMGLGMLIVGLTFHISIYLLGIICINFFTPHDMQVIYIQESCPKEKRATYYTIIKSIATLGVILIPILRSIFIPNNYDNWRMVYLLPAFIAFIVSIIALLLMRETEPFIDNRLKYLKMSDDDRIKANKQNDASVQRNGTIAGFKYLFQHKSLLWLALVDIFVWMGMGIALNYNVIMKYGFAGITSIEKVKVLGENLQTILDTQVVTINKTLYLFSIGSAIAQLAPGFIADKYGRRFAAIFSSIISLITFIMFWIGVTSGLNAYLCGLLIGLSVGSFWMVGDMVYFICSELVPTSIRVSVLNAFGIFMNPGLAIGILLPSLAGMIIGSDVYLALFTAIISIIGLSIASILLIFKVKETKNVDISTIKVMDD